MEFLLADWLGKPVWMWLGFHLVVAVLLAFDLGVLQKKTGDLGVKESLMLSAFYITLGLIFGAWVWWYISPAIGPRISHRLRDREVVVDGQRVRHRDDLRILRDPAPLLSIACCSGAFSPSSCCAVS